MLNNQWCHLKLLLVEITFSQRGEWESGVTYILFATYDAFSQTHRVFFSSLFKKQTPGLREYTQNFRKEREEKHSLFFSPLPLHCLAAAAFPLFRITLPMFRICYNLWFVRHRHYLEQTKKFRFRVGRRTKHFQNHSLTLNCIHFRPCV